jgi:hypothetical protein
MNIPEPSTPLCSENSRVADHNRTVHLVTQSKGGVGKSLISWNLAQYLRDKNRPIVAIDLDPMNHSLAEFHGLGARSLDLLTGDDAVFNGSGMDVLAQDMIMAGPGEDFVLDNGAAGFIGLTRYLVDNEFPGLLEGHGGRLVLHAVLGGGSASAQCLLGLHTLVEAFRDHAGVRFVLWLNEHGGGFVAGGMGLEDMALYKTLTGLGRVLGLVRLAPLRSAFLSDFERMRMAGLTYGEAIASPDFLLMNKQRLTVIRRGIWSQLDALGLVP